MSTRICSRRRFLQLVAIGGPAAIGSAPFAWAEDGDRKAAVVSFCHSLYGMRSLKLEDALKACAEIGFDGVELDSGREQAGDPEKLSKAARKRIGRQLQDLGLKLPALMENLALVTDQRTHRKNLDRLRALAQLGHELSPEQPPAIETVLGGRPKQWDSLKEKMAGALRDWAKAAEAAKTVVAIKAHVGGALHTPHDARWLLDRVDSRWIRLNYDYSHFRLRGFALKESLRLLLPDIAFIHVKDTRGNVGDFRFLLPGEGDIEYVPYFRLLRNSGYRGAVCVEVSGQIHGRPGYDPMEAARRSYANLAPAFKQAGLRRG